MASYPSIFMRFLLFVLPLLVCFLSTAPHVALAGELPQLDKPKGKECISPKEWMRRNHMDFLKHRREATVREGVRVRSESFRNCASCHTSRGKFCDRCHAYAVVAPDCFECHDYPK